MQNGPSTRGFVPFWCAGDFVPSSLRKGSSTPGERAEKIYEVFFQRKSGIKRRITSRDTDICLFAASVSSFSFSSRPWDVFDPGNGLRPAALFFRGRGEQKDESDRKHSSLPFNLLLSLLFFQEKEKQKEKQKRKMRPSFSPHFSFLFFFKKRQKKAGKKAGVAPKELLFRHFCFIFCKKNKQKKSKERRAFFWLFFVFLRNKKRKRGEARKTAGRCSPSV